ncbi:MAG: glycosyltransferase family 2 protein [Methanoregula sp.]
MPLVSVIIPTHNRNSLLVRAVKSVLAQTCSSCEIIIVDDYGDADMALREFGDRVHYIRIPRTPYPAESRNVGMKYAHGNYIAFLDDDDTWLPDKLSTQVQVFSDHPETALVCSDAYIVKPGTQAKPELLYLNNRNGKTGFLLDELINNNFVITSTCMVRRDALQKTGGFSTDPSFRGIEDYELWLRIARQFQMQYMPVPLAVYQDAEGSLRSEISRLRYHDGINRMYSTLQSELPATDQYTATHKRLTGKIYENNVGKLCLLLEMGDKVHFSTLFRDLIVAHPFLTPKMCVSVSRTYIRQMITGMAKNRKCSG